MLSRLRGAAVGLLVLVCGCASGPASGEPVVSASDEIVVCGRRFHTSAPVVLFSDPGGYDAYRPQRFFEPEVAGPRDEPHRIVRYGSVRRGLPPDLAERVARDGWSVGDLARAVRQIVIHYDAAGSSRRCFRILHDVRGLSCHFLLDLDGTIYQTLDVKERAWHAGDANDASVGIEIANVGAHRDRETLEKWFEASEAGKILGVVGFPPETRGRVQGTDLVQFPFTEAQYRSLAQLVATLCRALDVPPTAPRGPDGAVARDVLPDGERLGFRGIVGHLHVSASKVDPGPAFDWERLLMDLRRLGVR